MPRYRLQVPLKDSTLDVVIFSLALMGTNYPAFLAETWRVLKPKYATKHHLRSVLRAQCRIEILIAI